MGDPIPQVQAQPRMRPGSPHNGTPGRERALTGANVITVTRTAVAGALAFVAASERSLTLLLASLAVYWIGDMADGACARLFNHETRVGAVLDVVCDRFNSAAFYLGLAWLKPELGVPIALYLALFMTLDTLLSLAFLSWPVRSPNYFYEVDHLLWTLNWSRVAKALNSSVFVIVLLGIGSVAAAVIIAVALWILKSFSLWRLLAIGLPLPGVVSDRPVAAVRPDA